MSDDFFKTEYTKAADGSGELFQEEIVAVNSEPVTCLGKTFANDAERRTYFTEELRKKLRDPEFRKIEGFPIGEDEDILALSDPPYYCACPNPWIGEFIKEWEREKPPKDDLFHYVREPFAADVSEGKNDPIYNAHSYHTKVPHKAIMRYILHYTEPGDIVFDGFCGTGMTGVAAQMCGDITQVRSLGYKVDEKTGDIFDPEAEDPSKPISKLGARKAILNDLSPAATFIAYNYNTPVNAEKFEREAKRILAEVEAECGWMYETLHVEQASSLSIQRIFDSAKEHGWKHISESEVNKDQRTLPHWEYEKAIYFVTFRTYNGVILSDEAKDSILESIKFYHGSKINLYSAVVMPDHVHFLFQLLDGNLSELLHSIKSFSANQINKLMGRSGILWQTESYDHIVRDGKEFFHVINYIHRNPIKKNLCGEYEKYQWRWVSDEVEKAGWKPAPLGKINYVVWSDVFVCPNCMHNFCYWDTAVDEEKLTFYDELHCPHCHTILQKGALHRAQISEFDERTNKTLSIAKQTPVFINYIIPGSSKKYTKKIDEFDLSLLSNISNMTNDSAFPTDEMPDGFNTKQPKLSHGFTRVDQFFTKRNLYIFSLLWKKMSAIPMGRILLTSVMLKTASKLHNIGLKNGKINLAGAMPLVLFIPSILAERNLFILLRGKIVDFTSAFFETHGNFALETKSTTTDSLPQNSLDYVFVDPPFGSNINYSELSFIWEAWLGVKTNNKQEAIENEVQGKTTGIYRKLMTSAFRKIHAALKPGRWMTVEFSNTKAYIWNSIQSSLADAGFIVSNVSALDKGQGTFKSQTTPTAVKQDLIISAYKPNGGFEERFIQEAESETGVWDFIRTHLKYLPVAKIKDGKLMTIGERDPRLLFDQLVAYYVHKGYNVPISSQDFQTGLAERFDERDGLYFLPEQAAEYDKRRAGFQPPTQDSLFVSDEASAIIWLRHLLKQKPLTFQEINPLFMQELSAWNKYEKTLELAQLLEENFLMYDGKGEVPSQIHTYLSTNWHDFRDLAKDDPKLVAKAEKRWYVPDPNKACDLEKIRGKSLLREFEEYRNATKKLKLFRLEAVRAGFKHAYQERDYATILAVGKKIPENVLEEDEKLLMWFNQAEMRVEE